MLTETEIKYARKVIAFNGGTEEEQLRFRALSDEAARQEIADYKENRLIAVRNEFDFHTEKARLANLEISELEND